MGQGNSPRGRIKEVLVHFKFGFLVGRCRFIAVPFNGCYWLELSINCERY